MTLQNIIRLEQKYSHCNIKWQFMMANYEIVELIHCYNAMFDWQIYYFFLITSVQMLLANKDI